MPRSPSRWIRARPRPNAGALRTLGFNRLSFGVQDFDPRVQVAVHRVQSFEEVRALVQSARALGYASVNVDLIYGLPLQTTESFACTISQVIALRPDRIALYAYAPAGAVQAAAPHQRGGPARPRHPRGPAESAPSGSSSMAMPTSAWTISRCIPIRWRRQAARRAAPQFQGYSTQPDRDSGRVGHRPHRQYLQPERQDAGRILRGHRVRASRPSGAWS